MNLRPETSGSVLLIDGVWCNLWVEGLAWDCVKLIVSPVRFLEATEWDLPLISPLPFHGGI